MEHLAIIYTLNSRADAVPAPSNLLPTRGYRNALKVPIVARGSSAVIAASGSSFISTPGAGVYVSSGPKAGVRLGALGSNSVMGVLTARQSPMMGNLEISASDGVPRLYLRNYLDCELEVRFGIDRVVIPPRSQSHWDGPANAKYVPLGITVETPFFPSYRLLRPYDIIEFGL